MRTLSLIGISHYVYYVLRFVPIHGLYSYICVLEQIPKRIARCLFTSVNFVTFLAHTNLYYIRKNQV